MEARDKLGAEVIRLVKYSELMCVSRDGDYGERIDIHETRIIISKDEGEVSVRRTSRGANGEFWVWCGTKERGDSSGIERDDGDRWVIFKPGGIEWN